MHMSRCPIRPGTINSQKQPNSQLLEQHSKQRNDTNMYSCYNFVYLNIARLLLDNGKNKSKISFLADIFNEHTLFCGLCEIFLHSDILDAEVCLHGYNISRCDRIDRIGEVFVSTLEKVLVLRKY